MSPRFLVCGHIQARILDKGIKMFYDGHGLINRYRTLALKEIQKLPKLIMFTRNVYKKCLQEMFTRNVYKKSLQEMFTRNVNKKINMFYHYYTKSVSIILS